MANMQQLPKNWASVKTEFDPIAPARYLVTIEAVLTKPDGRFSVQYQIQDEGEFAGRYVFENFDLETNVGAGKFKHLQETLDIADDGKAIDLDLLKRRVLQIRVKHKEDEDGKVWENVTNHFRDDRQA